MDIQKIANKYQTLMVLVAGILVFGYGVYLHFHRELIAQTVAGVNLPKMENIYQTVGDNGVLSVFFIFGAVVILSSIYYLFQD